MTDEAARTWLKKIRFSRGVFEINLGAPQLDDVQLASFCGALEKAFTREEFGLSSDGSWMPVNVDISNSRLCGSTLPKFFKCLLEMQMAVLILKMHKNELGDAVVPAILDLVQRQPATSNVSEIHLSHNIISGSGAQRLIEGLCKSRRYEGSTLFLRLEQNRVWAPDKLLEVLLQAGYPVAATENVSQRAKPGVAVLLPFFCSQKESSTAPVAGAQNLLFAASPAPSPGDT
eukprot:CAMPEP_0204340960 /NCGR_PEP_ID=MMETSP0469-20131031/22985_1 /ASSEMBLY_ACC=CAM_ASM_000384 /TAXON_ID=2969 /ORGANISM="Oxyrrhis marina" /LENGTH=230 /DNA_ID=CAMNT_0051325595 /DNA_START=13 /DNA_END=702 /DNA_ORIENTATION=+